MTHCCHAVLESMVMFEYKATEWIPCQLSKNPITGQDYVFYTATKKTSKIQQFLPPMVWKQPLCMLFGDFNCLQCPIRCMLDLESTTFVISQNFTKAFHITAGALVIRGWKIISVRIHTLSLALYRRNYWSHIMYCHLIDIITRSNDYTASLPGWYCNIFRATETATRHLHIPHCRNECFWHARIHWE